MPNSISLTADGKQFAYGAMESASFPLEAAGEERMMSPEERPMIKPYDASFNEQDYSHFVYSRLSSTDESNPQERDARMRMEIAQSNYRAHSMQEANTNLEARNKRLQMEVSRLTDLANEQQDELSKVQLERDALWISSNEVKSKQSRLDALLSETEKLKADYTSEKEKFQGLIKGNAVVEALVQENAQLKAENETQTKMVVQLNNQNTNIEAEIAALANSENRKLSAKAKALQDENATLSSEKLALIDEKKKLKNKCEAQSILVDETSSEKAKLEKEVEFFRTENETLTADKRALVSEKKKAWKEEKILVEAKKNFWENEMKKQVAEKKALKDEKKKLQAEKKAFQREKAKLAEVDATDASQKLNVAQLESRRGNSSNGDSAIIAKSGKRSNRRDISSGSRPPNDTSENNPDNPDEPPEATNEMKSLQNENATLKHQVESLRIQMHAKAGKERGDVEMLRIENAATRKHYEAKLELQRKTIERLVSENRHTSTHSCMEMTEYEGDVPDTGKNKPAAQYKVGEDDDGSEDDGALNGDETIITSKKKPAGPDKKQPSDPANGFVTFTRDYPNEIRYSSTNAQRARIYMEAYSDAQAQVKQGKTMKKVEELYATRAGRVAECVKNCFQNNVEAFAASHTGGLSQLSKCSKGVKHHANFDLTSDEPSPKRLKRAPLYNVSSGSSSAIGGDDETDNVNSVERTTAVSRKEPRRVKKPRSKSNALVSFSRDFPSEFRGSTTVAGRAKVYLEAYNEAIQQIKEGKKRVGTVKNFSYRAGLVAQCVQTCFNNDIEAFAASHADCLALFEFATCCKGVKHTEPFRKFKK